MMKQANYDKKKTKFLVNGFRWGFSLNFGGNMNQRRFAPNLKLRVGSKVELWNKVMKEVEAKRYAGPYEEVPFDNFIQSLIGLMPKDQGRKTRLIFHLSYPRCNGTSVNVGIPKNLCNVRYPDFDEVIKMCQMLTSEQIFAGKSDMSMAFRHIPLRVQDFKLLILKAYHPITSKVWYFVEKCLPFGSSISCAIFQEISTSIAFLVTFRTKRPTLAYLDDYLFVEVLKMLCDWQVNQFLWVCDQINFPVSLKKTHWGTTLIVFLGFLLDLVNKRVGVPVDKIAKALVLIESLLATRKTMVHRIQKLWFSKLFV